LSKPKLTKSCRAQEEEEEEEEDKKEKRKEKKERKKKKKKKKKVQQYKQPTYVPVVSYLLQPCLRNLRIYKAVLYAQIFQYLSAALWSHKRKLCVVVYLALGF
jgi:hypothetical protein